MISPADRRSEGLSGGGLVFDPAVEGVSQAFERYAHLYSPGADVRATGSDFYASVEARLLPGLVVFSRTVRGVEHRRERKRIMRDGFEHLTLQLVDSGSLLVDAEGRSHRLGAGEGVLLDMTRPFRSEVSGRLFTLTIPRKHFSDAGLEISGLHGRLIAADGGRLRRALAASERDDAGDVAAAAIMEAALCRVPRGASGADRSTEPRRERALRCIEENLADPDLSPGQIALAAGMSRATLYRVFQPLGGVADWVQTRRLLRVRTLLAQRNVPIAVAGRNAGFLNASHLTFAFNARFGMTPSKFQARRFDDLDGARRGSAAEAALADIGVALARPRRDAAAA